MVNSALGEQLIDTLEAIRSLGESAPAPAMRTVTALVGRHDDAARGAQRNWPTAFRNGLRELGAQLGADLWIRAAVLVRLLVDGAGQDAGYVAARVDQDRL